MCEDTLKVKNLPKDLTDAEKEDFLRHFGAIQVKIITSKAKERSTAYAVFRSKAIAKNVMFRLHQAVVLNTRISVEYAENDLGKSLPPTKQVRNGILFSEGYYAGAEKFVKRRVRNFAKV